MNRTALIITVLLASAPALAATMSDPNGRVGGQAMFPSKTIVANAVNSTDHTTLVAAVKAAGLITTIAQHSEPIQPLIASSALTASWLE